MLLRVVKGCKAQRGATNIIVAHAHTFNAIGSAGAAKYHWEDRQVLRDRNWVNSRKPDDIPAFNREVINLISEVRRQKVA